MEPSHLFFDKTQSVIIVNILQHLRLQPDGMNPIAGDFLGEIALQKVGDNCHLGIVVFPSKAL